MSGAHIRTRVVKDGKRRYDVRYRIGGRGFRILHGGTFRTLTEAKKRRDLIAGELAAGRDPRKLLHTLKHPPKPPLFRNAHQDWLQSRHDVTASTRANYQSRVDAIDVVFGDRDPEAITPAEISAWVGELVERFSAGTVGAYVSQVRQVLGFAGVRPNPARDESIRLPSVVREEPHPPPGDHVMLLVSRLTRRWRLPLVTIEQTGMRVSEAVALEWPDVDVSGCRFRLSKTDTKRRRARWVQVPKWLMELIAETCPPEDRREGRAVFPDFSRRGARSAMKNACQLAGLPHYHPHDLRHRRTSLWHGQGVPEAELAKRIGHSRPSMTLDVYSHVMPLDEVPAQRLAELVRHG